MGEAETPNKLGICLSDLNSQRLGTNGEARTPHTSFRHPGSGGRGIVEPVIRERRRDGVAGVCTGGGRES